MKLIRDDYSIDISRAKKGFLLEARQTLNGHIADVFPFFANAGNLETITPPSLHFNILTPLPIDMFAGQRIDYKLRVHGVPIRWQSEISVWDPPYRFVDEQRRGPYRWWRHEHRFEAAGDQTLMLDRVEYGIPGGTLVNKLFVQPDLRKIFTYRAETLKVIFSTASSSAISGPIELNSRMPALVPSLQRQ